MGVYIVNREVRTLIIIVDDTIVLAKEEDADANYMVRKLLEKYSVWN